jgi:uncharacterized protein (TIGR03435 family)
MRLALFFTILGPALAVQEAGALRFEVASVKPAPPNAPRVGRVGGPGTSSPSRIHYGRITLKSLMAIAYAIDQDRIQGPQWSGIDGFVVDAKVPDGTDKDQFPLMLQNLLHDRFHLTVHSEITNFKGYELLVAERGPKIRKSADSGDASAENSVSEPTRVVANKDSEGFPILGPGRKYLALYSHGVERASYRNITLAEFARLLHYDIGPSLGDPFATIQVVDRTGLDGRFDFKLEFRQRFDDPNSDSPDIFVAVEKQLGLRLQKDIVPLPVLVIDRADRVPTEN